MEERFPNADLEIVRLFEEIVEVARSYENATGRYLPVFGELGELFAEITFGLDRHRPRTQGSDGRIGNDHVEVKTITPEKKSEKVVVKRSGNFSKLLIVKIDEGFKFESRMIDRKNMSKGSGKLVSVSWSSLKSGNAQ